MHLVIEADESRLLGAMCAIICTLCLNGSLIWFHLSRVGPTLDMCVMLYHCVCVFPYLLPPSIVCFIFFIVCFVPGAFLWVGDVSFWFNVFYWRPWTVFVEFFFPPEKETASIHLYWVAVRWWLV